jgi:D-3-phosphoglycerate dehydrogenase
MRMLAVGDSYMAPDYFRRAFEALEPEHEISYLTIDPDRPFVPRTASERRLREYEGTPAQLMEHLPGIEILVVHGAPVTDEVLTSSGVLRLVCCVRGGPANVDLDAASACGIPVVNTPGKNAEAVADQTLAFLIMLARGFPKAQRFLLAGGSVGKSAFEGAEFLGHDLADHVLGLVGFGHVGRRVAARASAFGMRILVHDPYLVADVVDSNAERVETLAALLAESDFVSLHARATPENENLFGAEEFSAMRRGAYFINTARETLVDDAALDEALASGHLGGAALDVVRPKDRRVPHPLLRHENVVITPHIGGATHETLLRGARMVADEIARFQLGMPLVNVVDHTTAEV